jgi:quercetin dioxygenase-like cupin family protein
MLRRMTSELCRRELPHDCREALFGGTGKVRVWALLEAPDPPFTAALACELEPGASVGAHVQEHFPELVIGISGAGTATVNGVALPLGGGSVVELPLGQTLAIANGSRDVPLRYLIIKAAPVTQR